MKSGRSQNSLENKCGTEMASKLGREQGTVPQERVKKRERRRIQGEESCKQYARSDDDDG